MQRKQILVMKNESFFKVGYWLWPLQSATEVPLYNNNNFLQFIATFEKCIFFLFSVTKALFEDFFNTAVEPAEDFSSIISAFEEVTV